MDEIDIYVLNGQLRRGEHVVLWLAHLGVFIEFNGPGNQESP